MCVHVLIQEYNYFLSLTIFEEKLDHVLRSPLFKKGFLHVSRMVARQQSVVEPACKVVGALKRERERERESREIR